MIAVAAYTFDRYSETFIRNHALKIFPGETAAVILEADSVFLPGFDLENVLYFGQSNLLWPGKLSSLLRLLVGGSVFYRGREAEKRLVGFLRKMASRPFWPSTAQSVARLLRRAKKLVPGCMFIFMVTMLPCCCGIGIFGTAISDFLGSCGIYFSLQFLAGKLCDSLGISSDSRIHVVPCCVAPESSVVRR